MAAADPVGASAAALFETLRAEASVLKRKQQRKGVEYRVKEGTVRPTITRGASGPVGLEGSMTLGSPKAGRPVSAPVAAGATTKGASAMADGLDDYDPHAAQAEEHEAMMADLSKAREEASSLHHRVMSLLSKREDLEHEMEQLAYEDGVERERDEGMKAIENTKIKVSHLETLLAEEDAYRATLDFMYVRGREQKVTTLSVQKAFEDSLAAHTREFDLKQGLLARVARAGEEETDALRKLQSQIRAELAELDRKLKARQQELWVRQEKARLRASKLEHDFALEGPPDALSPEETRMVGEKLRSLQQQANESRSAKVRAQAEADSAEAEYNKIRFAAGIQSTAGGAGGGGKGASSSGRMGLLDATGSHGGSTIDLSLNLGGTGTHGSLASSSSASAAAGHKTVGSAVDADDDLFDLGASSSGSEPDPASIVSRFATLEMELKQIEDQVGDYTTRLRALRHRHAYLEGVKQPMARDVADEADNDVSRIDKLTQRHDAAKRAVDVARAELREAESTKMQLHQSIRVLCQRLEAIPPLPASFTGDSPSEDEKQVGSLLDRDASALSSPWAQDLHAQIRTLVSRMHGLMRVVDEPAAVSAYHDAAQWLEMSFLPLQPDNRRSMASPGEGSRPGSRAEGGAGGVGSPQSASSALGSGAGDHTSSLFSAGSATGLGGGVSPRSGNIALLGSDEEIDRTIERLMSHNEWSIRVRPTGEGGGAAGGAGGGAGSAVGAGEGDSVVAAPTATTAKVLQDAAQMFERQLREGVTMVLRGDTAGAGGGSSAASVGTGADTATLSGGGRGSRSPRRARNPSSMADEDEKMTVTNKSERSSSEHAWGRRASIVGQATAALKPKPRELQKMLAAALQMSGTEVDEHLMSSARREAEEVVTRDALKRATKTQLRQMLRAKRAAASREEAAAKAAGGGGGGAGQ